MNETNVSQPAAKPIEKRGNPVAITAIIAITIVLLTCILACAGTMITYILNSSI